MLPFQVDDELFFDKKRDAANWGFDFGPQSPFKKCALVTCMKAIETLLADFCMVCLGRGCLIFGCFCFESIGVV